MLLGIFIFFWLFFWTKPFCWRRSLIPFLDMITFLTCCHLHYYLFVCTIDLKDIPFRLTHYRSLSHLMTSLETNRLLSQTTFWWEFLWTLHIVGKKEKKKNKQTKKKTFPKRSAAPQFPCKWTLVRENKLVVEVLLPLHALPLSMPQV